MQDEPIPQTSTQRAREALFEKLSSRADLTAEQMTVLLGAVVPPQEAAEVQLARIQAQSSGVGWKRESVMLALVGVLTPIISAVVTIVTANFSGVFDIQTKVIEQETALAAQQNDLDKLSKSNDFELKQGDANQRATLAKAEFDQRAEVIRNLLVITPEEIGAISAADFETRAANERKARICLLSSFGVLTVPDYMIGVAQKELESYANKAVAFLDQRYDCADNPVPSVAFKPVSKTAGSPSSSQSIDPSDLKYGPNFDRDSFVFSVENGRLMDAGKHTTYYQSPNGGSFRELADRHLLVVDYTGATNLFGSIHWMLQEQANASNHLLIGRHGEIVQLRSFDQTAWHAGRSRHGDLEGLNNYSISVALVNAGRLTDKTTSLGQTIEPSEVFIDNRDQNWQSYTDVQKQTLEAVLGALVEAFPRVKTITSKAAISEPPGRQVGPGPALGLEQIVERVLRNQN